MASIAAKQRKENDTSAEARFREESLQKLCAEILGTEQEPRHPAKAGRGGRTAHARQVELDRLSAIVDALAVVVLLKEKEGLAEQIEQAQLKAIDAQIPHFETQKQFDAWWDALPKVKAEVDPRLRERVKTSIRLSRRTIDGFDFLAKQKGIRSGQTLMKVVLESYLAKSLPPDF